MTDRPLNPDRQTSPESLTGAVLKKSSAAFRNDLQPGKRDFARNRKARGADAGYSGGVLLAFSQHTVISLPTNFSILFLPCQNELSESPLEPAHWRFGRRIIWPIDFEICPSHPL
jgi:hypothetical protein